MPRHVAENRALRRPDAWGRPTGCSRSGKSTAPGGGREKPWGQAAEADALVTRSPGLAIGVLTADCAPVLFCDPKARVIGAAHAGWRGALSGVVEATVADMDGLGAEARAHRRGHRPLHLASEAYEVGADYRERFLAEDPESDGLFRDCRQLLASRISTFRLCGRAAVAGRRAERRTDLGLCTYCDETRLFSYRRSQHHGEPDYGRQISAIVLT